MIETRNLCSKKGCRRVLNLLHTLDRSLGSAVTRCSVSLAQSSTRTFFSRALITCNVKDKLEQGRLRQTPVTREGGGATRRPSWLRCVLPAPALPTPGGQTPTAPPPGWLAPPPLELKHNKAFPLIANIGVFKMKKKNTYY